jgi:hypothetical protein
MDWTNERYVRLYTRDTETVLLQPWQARHIFREMCRKCDRAGVIECRTGPRGLAVILQMASDVETVATYLPHLLEDGSVVQIQDGYFLPNFMDANEAPQSDKQRAKESRHNRRDRAKAHNIVTKRDDESQNVTQPSHDVTRGHTASLQPSQPSPSDPSNPAVLRSAAATSSEEMISLGAIDLTVAANNAITARFGEQTKTLRSSNGKTHTLTEIVVNNGIPIDFAVRSIERQVKAAENPISTMRYFRDGILDDWGKHKDAAASAPLRFAQNDGVIPIRPASSPVAPEDEGVVCKICRTKELHIVNGRQTPKHNEGCAMGTAVKQIGN